MLAMVSINILTLKTEYHYLIYYGSLVIFVGIAIMIMIKTRRNNEKLKPIGEVEVTQSCIKKNIGGVTTEHDYQSVKEITLTKHMPSTRPAESKGRYFSYILKIESIDGEEDTFVVADRSIDKNHKLSVLNTLKTLKKIVPFEVKIDT
jgi:hypothetical protein